jgi:hypothetical protein
MLAAMVVPAKRIEHMAVGLGARDELGRDVRIGADLVLDQHRTPGERPQLLGEVAHENVAPLPAGKPTIMRMSWLG